MTPEPPFCEECGHELTFVTTDPRGAALYDCEPCVYRKATIISLKRYQSLADSGAAHKQAVFVLCELLETLGFEDVVAEFKKVPG